MRDKVAINKRKRELCSKLDDTIENEYFGWEGDMAELKEILNDICKHFENMYVYIYILDSHVSRFGDEKLKNLGFEFSKLNRSFPSWSKSFRGDIQRIDISEILDNIDVKEITVTIDSGYGSDRCQCIIRNIGKWKEKMVVNKYEYTRREFLDRVKEIIC